jgi:hypothetical protein
MNDEVLYELDGHVATITYHRPDALNAVTAQRGACSTTRSLASATRRRRGWRSSPGPVGRSAPAVICVMVSRRSERDRSGSGGVAQ